MIANFTTKVPRDVTLELTPRYLLLLAYCAEFRWKFEAYLRCCCDSSNIDTLNAAQLRRVYPYVARGDADWSNANDIKFQISL